jgi:hypothetical protein
MAGEVRRRLDEILDLRERVGGDPAAFHDRLLALGTPPPAIAARRLAPL